MHDFDRVTFFYAYHDITNLGVDRAKMHKAFYEALKPGGELVVGDYSAKAGAGTSAVQTLHRSDETLVTPEIEAAGFKLIDRGDFLRVPGDARDTHSHGGAEPVDICLGRSTCGGAADPRLIASRRRLSRGFMLAAWQVSPMHDVAAKLL
jgi:hypothetical protein